MHANARSKATTSCFAIWCKCFHHRASCPSSERYWKGCQPSATGTSARNDATSRAIQLAHLRNHHVTVTETALITVGNHNRHIHPKTEKPIARVWSAISSTLHWFSSHSCTSHTSYGLVGGTWSQTISNEEMETGLFHSFSSGRLTSCIPTSWGTLRRRLRS